MWYSCFPNVALLPWEFLANLTWEEDCYTAELHGLEDIPMKMHQILSQMVLRLFRGREEK